MASLYQSGSFSSVSTIMDEPFLNRDIQLSSSAIHGVCSFVVNRELGNVWIDGCSARRLNDENEYQGFTIKTGGKANSLLMGGMRFLYNQAGSKGKFSQKSSKDRLFQA